MRARRHDGFGAMSAHGDRDELRRRIAVAAATIIAESGQRNFNSARRKASNRLGVADRSALPTNQDIEIALREHQRLFQSHSQPAALSRMRETAIEALQFFAAFGPLLVGPVWDGTADENSSVCLHVFADSSEDVALFLRDNMIPYEVRNRRLRFDTERAGDHPVFVFAAGDVSIDLTVLSPDQRAQAPLDRVSEQPMSRANLAALRLRMEQESDSILATT
ncbi:MAG: hypothetical protein ABI451_03860 [Dokdonella sp.]